MLSNCQLPDRIQNIFIRFPLSMILFFVEKKFIKKRYTFHFILHTIIADKILTFKDAEARDRNQQKC